MKSFDGGFVRRLAYPPHLVSAIRQLGESKGRQELFARQTPQVLDSLQKAAVIESAESSNRIEGVVAPRRRVKAIVEGGAPGNRSEAEIAGYRDVLTTIHGSHPHMRIGPGTGGYGDLPLGPALVLQFHRDLFRYAATPGGSWKIAENDIIERRPDGTVAVRFRPVPPLDVGRYMDGLHEGFAAEWLAGEVDPLVLIPAYVLDFLCIHPFPDGNGRMARLLSLLLAYKGGYGVGRFISLERIVERTKESYYDTLYRSSQGWHEGAHDLLPWTEYFLGVLTAAYREFEERVGELTTAKGAKTQLIEQAIEGLPATFRITDVEARCPNVSREMIRVVLKRLKGEDRVRSEGSGVGAVWRKLP